MKKTKILTLIIIILILLPLGWQEIKTEPFPNLFWFYRDSINLDNNIKWNYTRTLDKRYWVIQPINDRLDVYFLLNITVISNTTIDVFLFGDGGAPNELDIPEGTKAGVQQFSFQYLLKPSKKESTSCVYLYIDNSDDDGRGTPYEGDALVKVFVSAQLTIFPIVVRFLLIFIPIAILGIGSIILYNLKKRRRKLN
ncbi:MAG: hypothetical protein ACFFD2_20705 [Promethearchaeota archaeon]